jgi:hypothetical protein
MFFFIDFFGFEHREGSNRKVSLTEEKVETHEDVSKTNEVRSEIATGVTLCSSYTQ